MHTALASGADVVILVKGRGSGFIFFSKAWGAALRPPVGLE